MLVLVVGPSGAGKDSLLNAAREVFRDDPRISFARRVITRPADPDGENHEPVTDAEFAARDFALSWSAHGLRYGIAVEATRNAAVVVANISRGVIGEAARRFHVRVIEVTAPPRFSPRGWPHGDGKRLATSRAGWRGPCRYRKACRSKRFGMMAHWKKALRGSSPRCAGSSTNECRIRPESLSQRHHGRGCRTVLLVRAIGIADRPRRQRRGRQCDVPGVHRDRNGPALGASGLYSC